MARGFQLEGAVLDLEVPFEALAERAENPCATTVRENLVRDDDMSG